ncbi:MAG: GIY-YIG nuclease family protein [Gammaproteobacteria bacterium]|nr:GIY-YIG nuclease family protein [Gammaproteobacteria bacterium]
MTELLAEPGTYALWLRSETNHIVEIGKFGRLQMVPGFYIYIGSAFGPGGIKARVGRHLRQEKNLRWHIDYLRQYTSPVKVWLAYEKHLEHQWAGKINKHRKTSIPLAGFGSSDCRCPTHLFYSEEILDHPSGAKRLTID